MQEKIKIMKKKDVKDLFGSTVHELYKKLGFKEWGKEFRLDLKSETKS